jgi:hypothetical protein
VSAKSVMLLPSSQAAHTAYILFSVTLFIKLTVYFVHFLYALCKMTKVCHDTLQSHFDTNSSVKGKTCSEYRNSIDLHKHHFLSQLLIEYRCSIRKSAYNITGFYLYEVIRSVQCTL